MNKVQCNLNRVWYQCSHVLCMILVLSLDFDLRSNNDRKTALSMLDLFNTRLTHLKLHVTRKNKLLRNSKLCLSRIVTSKKEDVMFLTKVYLILYSNESLCTRKLLITRQLCSLNIRKDAVEHAVKIKVKKRKS